MTYDRRSLVKNRIVVIDPVHCSDCCKLAPDMWWGYLELSTCSDRQPVWTAAYVVDVAKFTASTTNNTRWFVFICTVAGIPRVGICNNPTLSGWRWRQVYINQIPTKWPSDWHRAMITPELTFEEHPPDEHRITDDDAPRPWRSFRSVRSSKNRLYNTEIWLRPYVISKSGREELLRNFANYCVEIGNQSIADGDGSSLFVLHFVGRGFDRSCFQSAQKAASLQRWDYRLNTER